MVGTLLLVVRTSLLEAETFELRLVGANLEKALEKGVLGSSSIRYTFREERGHGILGELPHKLTMSGV